MIWAPVVTAPAVGPQLGTKRDLQLDRPGMVSHASASFGSTLCNLHAVQPLILGLRRGLTKSVRKEIV